MKGYDDIISRFDDIQDLPVSEEMLGAYLEGNLDDFDNANISNRINSDLYLMNLEFDVKSSNSIYSDEYFLNIEENELELIDLPEIEIFEFEESSLASESSNSEMINIGTYDETHYDLPNVDSTSVFDDCLDSESQIDNNF